MKIWLLDTEAFVKINGLKPVTNAIMFDKGNVPTVDGLFSTEIFGISNKERKETWAYIDLETYFINPKVYISLKRLNRNFEAVVYSSKKFSISKDGQLVPDENGNTGIKWLYDNWEKFKFNKNESNSRNQKVDVVSADKRLIFMRYQVVLPAFFRDVNLHSGDRNPKVPEINDVYAKIIRNIDIIRESNKMDFVMASVAGKTQDLIVDVYNLLKEKIEKKNGYIRKFLMGKSVDYASRVVITAAPYTAETPREQYINFTHSGIPLSHTCSLFTPFIIYWLRRFFKNNVEAVANNFPVIDSKGNPMTVKLDNPEAYFSEDYLIKKLGHFVKNTYARFDTIELPISKEELARTGLKKLTLKFKGLRPLDVPETDETVTSTMGKEEDEARGIEVDRDMTWTDLLYRAAVEVSEDKHVVITRYPITDYNGSIITKITVLSTRETMPMLINNRLFPAYPKIDLTASKSDLDSMFRDTINIPAVFLPGLGGDHDGDQITAKAVWSQEANEECEQLMYDKKNILTITGNNIRVIEHEGAQSLYALTVRY